ncbi:MAG: hypothetical protein IJX05_06155 [Clostridia bacterium]|nr:hypothetical protein [Clostridia bacterium]
MIKDIIISALGMLNLTSEAEKIESGEEKITAEFLRLYNLVISEINDVYRREHATAPKATSIYDDACEFYGISDRVIAYGVAAEYCITQGLDEAELWDERYKSALAMAKRKRISISARRLL